MRFGVPLLLADLSLNLNLNPKPKPWTFERSRSAASRWRDIRVCGSVKRDLVRSKRDLPLSGRVRQLRAAAPAPEQPPPSSAALSLAVP